MDAYANGWLDLLVRSLHVIAAIAWIGTSFYFVLLDQSLRPPKRPEDSEAGVGGELWEVHGGGFYQVQKYRVAPPQLPDHLAWFKWEAYTTWVSGFALLVVLYYFDAHAYLIDPDVADLSTWEAVAISVALLAAAWIVFVPRRYAWTALAVAAVFFVTGGAIMWDRTIKDTDKGVFPNHTLAARGWVDAAVPSSAKVTLLTDGSGQCSSTTDRYAFLMTEFYNDRIERVPYVGFPLDYGPPTHRVHVSANGTLRASDGRPVAARYIVAPRGLIVAGRRLAVGTNARLVLWQTSGTVRFEGVSSDVRFLQEACA